MDRTASAPLDVGAARDHLVVAARAAGEAAMAFYRPGATTTARVSYKSSNSPVTDADYAADAAIRQAVTASLPDCVVFSEEAAGGEARFSARRVIVVDPIDGTRAFMQGRCEWCISLALMENDRPVAGVIHAPARGEMFAAAEGLGASLNGRPLPRRGAPTAPYRVTGPNRLIDTLTDHWPPLADGETLRALAYRLVSVAAGAHDIAVATTGAHDWDIAAADLILAECGCSLVSLTGRRPVYNARNPVHPPLLTAPEALAGRLLAPIDAATF